MRKAIIIAVAGSALPPAAGAPKYSGTISDHMCGAGHKSMNMGGDGKCVTACVKSMGARYVLWDGKTAYERSDEKGAEKSAGKKVTVTGTADEARTLQAVAIAAAG